MSQDPGEAWPIAVGEVTEGRSALADAILRELPEWFGIPASRDAYVAAADRLPMLVARAGPETLGFLSLLGHGPAATEIAVIGVRRDQHGRGVGRALVEAAAARVAGAGGRYLTVKTLGPDDPDPHYAATQAFYAAVGFEPLEVFATLWDGYPCLMMIRRVA